MTKAIFLLLALAALLPTVIKAAAPKTIEDYFLTVPDQYLNSPSDVFVYKSEAARKKLLKVQTIKEGGDCPKESPMCYSYSVNLLSDVKNGFLSFTVEKTTSVSEILNVQMGIFKKANGRYVLAISNSRSVDAGINECDIAFLEYRDGSFDDVKDKSFPADDFEKYVNEKTYLAFDIPRIGTEMKVQVLNRQTHLTEKTLKYAWDRNKGSFVAAVSK